jgi:hypothetical protein
MFMARIDLISARAKVYWRLALFPIVLYLIADCVARSQTTSATSSFSFCRQVFHSALNAAHTGLRERSNPEDLMAFTSKKNNRRKKSKRPQLTFETLEPRAFFSATQLALPTSDQFLIPDALSGSLEPPLLPMNSPPPLASVWKPLVYAGQDVTIASGSTALLNGEIISNTTQGLTTEWRLVSGPGAATISNANTANATATFSAAGVYEFELRVANNFASASDRVRVTVAEIINIDQSWLNAQGDGPYYLDQAGKTYVLQTDVTTDGTAFAIIAQNVTFDLNGHTITYNNAAPITIANGSFEQGSGTSATSWNFANAPSATRHQGVWLHNEIYDGNYSLKFSNTTTNQFVRSTTTITLEANTTYSLSAMFELGGQSDYQNPGVKGYVRLIGTNGQPTREVYWNSTNWRGIQLREGVFTTGATAETYTIRVGIEGHAASTKPFYIDDIKLQRTQNYGVVVSPKAWNPAATPGLSKFGAATNATVKNGTIVQGRDAGTYSHGVLIYADTGAVLSNLDVMVHGANSSTLAGKDMYTNPVTISNNTLTSNVQTITSRDNFDGAVVKGLVGSFTDNTIMNGPHGGIIVGGNGAACIISGNTIQLKAKYTNAFAIIGTASSQIFNNTILCGTGEYTARGIGLSSGTASNPTKVYGNRIEVQNLPNNQEYEGNIIGGTYGIQVESASHIQIYDNEITAFGTTKGYALRFTGVSTDVHVHHNVLRAIANGTDGRAAPLSVVVATGGNILLEDNTLVTNDGIIGEVGNSMGFELRRTTFQVDNPIASPKAFTLAYVPGTGVHSTLHFIDTVFSDQISRD